MFKKAFYHPGETPDSNGPAYSPAICVDMGERKMIFMTGQIPVDAEGNVVFPGDAAAQAEYTFDKADKLLNEMGASLKDVVKAQIFVDNVDDWPAIAPVRNRVFAENKPVSTVVEIVRGTDPGCLLELDLIAII